MDVPATWSQGPQRERLSAAVVVVLMGGGSHEREVSMTSGRAVLEALGESPGPDSPSHGVQPRVLAVELRAGGAWSVGGEDLDPGAALAALPKDAIFMLALHGGAGEDGRLQGFLDVAQRRYTGASAATSALCMDKHRSRLVAGAAGLRVAPGWHLTRGRLLRQPTTALGPVLEAVDQGPLFVKHCAEGSSFGVHRCTDGPGVRDAVDSIVASGGDVLVEREVCGLETTCGLLGDGLGATALPVAEIVPRAGAYFDYEQKYAAQGGAVETCPPALLPAPLTERIQLRAREAWDAFGGTGYGRLDFIVPRAGDGSFDPDTEPVFLEANTLPGMTPRSLLPLAAGAAGMGFRELVLEILATA